MKGFFTSLGVAVIVAIGLVPAHSPVWAAPVRSSMSITILPSTGPRTITRARAVTFRLKVTGIRLDARKIGKAPADSEGHIQVYADRIPSDAYAKKDLRRYWLAALAAPTFILKLSAAMVGGRGRHKIIVALAKNNDVLYRVPAASFTITVRS